MSVVLALGMLCCWHDNHTVADISLVADQVRGKLDDGSSTASKSSTSTDSGKGRLIDSHVLEKGAG